MKGKIHIAPFALPPVVNVAHGVLPAVVLSVVVVSASVVVSQAVPINNNVRSCIS